MPTKSSSDKDITAIYVARARRLANIRKSPEDLPALKAYYRDHPAQFINDWGQTYDPRNIEIGLPAVIPFALFPRQVEWIDWLLARWKAREDGLTDKSRDMGLSWLSVGTAVALWLFYPGMVVGFGSRKEEYVDKIGDPKSLFWKARMFIDGLPVEFRPIGWDSQKHAPHMRILNPENGSSILGEAGDNIGRGNRTSIYFKDESAFYERPELIDAALSQTSNCKIDLSTPNGAGNPFYQKRHGGRISVFTFHWRDDPRKGEAWYEKQKHDLDPVILAQEVDIDYTASVTNVFIPGEDVEDGQSPKALEPVGPLQLGVDVARFGDDLTVLTLRQGRVVHWQKSYSKIDTMTTAAMVRMEVKNSPGKIEQIAVDVIGLGAGVVDRLMEWDETRKITIAVNSAERVGDGRNYNLRAFMWSEMRDWLRAKPVQLPANKQIKAEISSPRYKFKSGLLLIESKDEMKSRQIKSPDYADSLALTFAMPVKRMKTIPTMQPWRPKDAGMGY